MYILYGFHIQKVLLVNLQFLGHNIWGSNEFDIYIQCRMDYDSTVIKRLRPPIYPHAQSSKLSYFYHLTIPPYPRIECLVCVPSSATNIRAKDEPLCLV